MTRGCPAGGYREEVSVEPGRPPLSMRFKRRAWIRVDWALAAVFALLIYGTLFKGHGMYVFPLSLWLAGDWAPPLLAVIVALPVGLRRRDPVGALLLALVGCTLVVAVGGEITRGPFLPLALALYMVAATRTRTVAIGALAASLALLVLQGVILSLTGRGSGPATGVALILIIAWMIGMSVQQRRSYTARVREQVATAAVTEERLRIARELHDVVAHSMTVVAVQAGFGEYVFDNDPSQARAALGNIQHVTREALSDMQRLLGVLRQDGTGQPGPEAAGAEPGKAQAAGPARQLQLAPAPGLADLERLVSTTAGAGVQVALTRTGDRRDIPAAIDQSAFRIVQEALTNVVKHSGASTCQVIIGYEADGLTVEITDPGGDGQGSREPHPARTDGTGHGLLGMRERVGLCGGEFTAGPRPGEGFEVIAHFPLPAAPRPERAPAVEPIPVRAVPGQAR
jgi:signal transduction histidine kinase